DAYRISEQPSIDTLTDQLSPLNVGSGTSGTEQKVFELVDVRHIGFAVPQPLLVKIKSRSQLSKGRFHLKDAYLQLYLGQIPALCLGIHNGNGVFTSIDEIRLDSERCSAAKEKVQPGLRKLRRLLEQIQSAVIERGQGAKLSLICQGGKLLLMQREPGDSFLPPTILKRFTSQVIQVSSLTGGTTPKESSVVDVQRIGSAVPQSSLVKVKSRTQHRGRNKLHDNEVYLQLYLGQITAACLGMHDCNDVFTRTDEIRFDSERCSAAKERAQPTLCKLRRLLEQIQSVAMECGQ
ncbi:uncharacterized protein PHACADRAFT_201611, partial [Phanerochaete carnosa HHB-10118-sp]